MEQKQGLKCSVCGGYLAPAKLSQDDAIERINSRFAVANPSELIGAFLYGYKEYPLSMYVCNRCGLAYFFKEQ